MDMYNDKLYRLQYIQEAQNTCMSREKKKKHAQDLTQDFLLNNTVRVMHIAGRHM